VNLISSRFLAKGTTFSLPASTRWIILTGGIKSWTKTTLLFKSPTPEIVVASSCERIHVVERPDNWRVCSLEERRDVYESGNPVKMNNVGRRKLIKNFLRKPGPIVIHEGPCTARPRNVSGEKVTSDVRIANGTTELSAEAAFRLQLNDGTLIGLLVPNKHRGVYPQIQQRSVQTIGCPCSAATDVTRVEMHYTHFTGGMQKY
jgi:hypothetical protein